jgi:MFS family permease
VTTTPSTEESRDLTWSVISTVAFAFALSASGVALPLLALDVGYSLTLIGVLTASSAFAQLAIRLVVGGLMRRYTERMVAMAAALTMAVSTVVVAVSAELLPFVICQLCQGVARGAFWTGSQAHVVRGRSSAARGLSRTNLASTAGSLFGPLLAGLLAQHSMSVVLLVSTAFAVAAACATAGFAKLPPVEPMTNPAPGMLWLRPGVDVGAWSGMTPGGWRGLLNSYLPVALAASHAARTVGALVSLANLAALGGATLVGKMQMGLMRRAFVPVTLICAVTTGATAIVAPSISLVAVALAASGVAVGMLQVIGPAIALEAVDPRERGDVLAVVGTFRAVALLGSPLAVAGLLGVLTLGPSIAIIGAAMAAPALFTRRLPHR